MLDIGCPTLVKARRSVDNAPPSLFYLGFNWCYGATTKSDPVARLWVVEENLTAVLTSPSVTIRCSYSFCGLQDSMINTPPREAFTRAEWTITQRLRTPRLVQRYLSSIPYNWELEGGTDRTFREVVRLHTAHCLEAALAAAVIMEQHGYPPLLLSIASKDKLDHVIFVFKTNGKWGSIGRSRDVGLHGRQAVFRSLRDLTWSYFDPYVDYSGRIVGYGLADLRELNGYDWRFSAKNVPKIARYLNEIPHRKLTSSNKRYRQLLERYKQWKIAHPGEPLADYAHRDRWML